MARPRKTVRTRKDHVVTFRLPGELHDRLRRTAANAGMTVTDLLTASLGRDVDRLVVELREIHASAPEVRTLAPEVFAELSRIGNNVNQIAHAVNSSLPPHVQNAYLQAQKLLTLLLNEERTLRQRLRTRSDGSEDPPTGDEL